MPAKHAATSMAVLALSAGAAAAQAIPCGQTYPVEIGDTLGTIADRAYGTETGWRLIFDANRDLIGADPGVIEVGQPLLIPCADGQASGTSLAVPADPAPDPVPEADPDLAPDLGPSRVLPGGLRLVTAGNFAPFTDQTQAQGGMMTDVVNRALANVLEGDAYRIDFVNDWGAHLVPLLSDTAYDIGFPWFRPNCEQAGSLGPDAQFRCTSFDWSEPLYEQVLGYYTPAQAGTLVEHGDFFGATVCRPAGYATFMLEEFELMPPNVTLVRPTDPLACFEGLVSGEVDLVVISEDVGNGIVARLEMSEAVARQEQFDYFATLHAITARGNPGGAAALASLNAGLEELKDSGEWFSIVRRHLAEFQNDN